MKGLLAAVSSVVTALIGSTVFDDPEGGTHAMRYYLGEMPDKRETGNGEDFPFCLTSVGEITLARDGKITEAVIRLGLFEAGTKSDALTMVDATLTLLDDLATSKYAGYKLIGEYSGSYEGEYPYYELTLSGQFKKVK